MKMTKIYTRTGDKGTTSLVGGVRVAKTHARLEAYGTIDELNSVLGWLIAVIRNDEQGKKLLSRVQHKLFTVGSYLATDPEQTEYRIETNISEDDIACLEQAIDAMNETLPPLQGFILPGGGQEASLAHVCRTVCRRAERRIYAAEEAEQTKFDGNMKRFINRLSDFLFVYARKLNLLSGENEIYWDKNCK